MVDLIISTKEWYGITLKPLCTWDAVLHVMLPSFFMIALGAVAVQDRLRKDKKMINECEDIVKILSSLTQGVALTANFPQAIEEAEAAAEALKAQSKKSQTYKR